MRLGKHFCICVKVKCTVVDSYPVFAYASAVGNSPLKYILATAEIVDKSLVAGRVHNRGLAFYGSILLSVITSGNERPDTRTGIRLFSIEFAVSRAELSIVACMSVHLVVGERLSVALVAARLGFVFAVVVESPREGGGAVGQVCNLENMVGNLLFGHTLVHVVAVGSPTTHALHAKCRGILGFDSDARETLVVILSIGSDYRAVRTVGNLNDSLVGTGLLELRVVCIVGALQPPGERYLLIRPHVGNVDNRGFLIGRYYRVVVSDIPFAFLASAKVVSLDGNLFVASLVARGVNLGFRLVVVNCDGLLNLRAVVVLHSPSEHIASEGVLDAGSSYADSCSSLMLGNLYALYVGRPCTYTAIGSTDKGVSVVTVGIAIIASV